jgi:hypothetical protein
MDCSKCDMPSSPCNKTRVLEDYILVTYDAASMGDQLMTFVTKIK